jgi:hypothetical protein
MAENDPFFSESVTVDKDEKESNHSSAPKKSTGFTKQSKASKSIKKDDEERQKGQYAEKYKYVRFVEKKKVLRKMKQIQGLLMGCLSGESNELSRERIEAQLAAHREDLVYVDKFPGNEKYISLFPTEPLSDAAKEKQKKIKSMILEKTNKNLNKSNNKNLNIKFDSFFTETAAKLPQLDKRGKPRVQQEKKSAEYVHPSWEAKKNNERLTGSIANQKFEGKKITFED